MAHNRSEGESAEARLAEEAEAALRESLERAHELICDAKLIVAEPRGPESKPSGRAVLLDPRR